MADQCEATEGELNFHKGCTEAREIQISAGIWNAITLKDFGKTFLELNKLAESVVKGNFGGLRERANLILQDRRDNYVLCFNEAWSLAQRPRLFAVLVQK